MIARIVLLILLSGGLLSQTEARAQLFLEDGKKVLSVSPGEHVSGSLLIHNTAGDTAKVKVYWEDFQYKAPYDGSKNFLPAGTLPDSSASGWVTFSPQDFTLPGFGQQKVDYVVDVPNTFAGGHYGVLFFERSSPQLQGEPGLSIITRVGCLFFIEPKAKDKKSQLQDPVLKGKGVTLQFANLGNVILIPHITYYLMQDEGMVVLRGDAGKLYVPPGATADFEVPIKEKLQPGNYTLFINADLGEGDVTIKEVKLTVDAAGGLAAAGP